MLNLEITHTNTQLKEADSVGQPRTYQLNINCPQYLSQWLFLIGIYFDKVIIK